MLRMGHRVIRGAARATGRGVAASLQTRARRIAVLIFVIFSFILGSHMIQSNNAEIVKEEKQIHQQDAREAAQFAKAKPPPDTPDCTTSTKSGTHTVRVDAKGRVSTTHTSGTTTKTCK